MAPPRPPWPQGLAATLVLVSSACAVAPPIAPDAHLEGPAQGFLGVTMRARPVPGGNGTLAHIELLGVVERSPAAAAGLQIGDVIIAVDGEDVTAHPDDILATFGARVRGLGPGARMRLTIRRHSVYVATAIDGNPIGPPQHLPGPPTRSGTLPDLAQLLEEHPEELVTVEARTQATETEVSVVLGRPPGKRDTPLPANASLRPDLQALPLSPEADIAANVLRLVERDGRRMDDAFEGLRQRFDADEEVEDAFRLTTVRYLHRDPLRLAGTTRLLVEELRPVAQYGGDARGLERLFAVARVQTDAPGSARERHTFTPPPRGSLPEEHARFVLARLDAAEDEVERALASLSASERSELEEMLPELAERFEHSIALQRDDDTARRNRHVRAVELLAKVDRAALLDGLEALLVFSDRDYLERLRADLKTFEQAGATSSAPGTKGTVLWHSTELVIGGSGNNEYHEPHRVVLDLDGDDRYHVPVGGAGVGQRSALCIDLGGDDRYQSTAPFAQGAALLGVALLVDAAGNDRYTSSAPFAQGASLAGAAVLADFAGDDSYRATTYAQGAALAQGLAALVDGDGDDHVEAGLYAQGFAGPGALATLLTAGGNDRYVAFGQAPSSYGNPGVFRGMSQGAAVGFRHMASGGIAALVDDGGSDSYEGGDFSQGGGYYFGWGMLADLGGDSDSYEGSRYAQGFAAHSALGSFWEDGGDDVYRGWVGAQNGAAWDLSVAAFLEDGGDDRYETGLDFSLGASAHNGFALFFDAGGADRYRVNPGRAGPNDYHGGESTSVFVDAGSGTDLYERGGPAANEMVVGGEMGVAVDVDNVDRGLRHLGSRLRDE